MIWPLMTFELSQITGYPEPHSTGTQSTHSFRRPWSAGALQASGSTVQPNYLDIFLLEGPHPQKYDGILLLQQKWRQAVTIWSRCQSSVLQEPGLPVPLIPRHQSQQAKFQSSCDTWLHGEEKALCSCGLGPWQMPAFPQGPATVTQALLTRGRRGTSPRWSIIPFAPESGTACAVYPPAPGSQQAPALLINKRSQMSLKRRLPLGSPALPSGGKMFKFSPDLPSG